MTSECSKGSTIVIRHIESSRQVVKRPQPSKWLHFCIWLQFSGSDEVSVTYCADEAPIEVLTRLRNLVVQGDVYQSLCPHE